MASGKVKLFKIASEINIGKEAIVEYLQSKSYDIQNKATAILDDKMVELVMEKFKKEKRAAEIQRDKIQKHKDIRVEPKIEEKSSTTIPEKTVQTPIVQKDIFTEKIAEQDKKIEIIENKEIISPKTIDSVVSSITEEIVDIVKEKPQSEHFDKENIVLETIKPEIEEIKVKEEKEISKAKSKKEDKTEKIEIKDKVDKEISKAPLISKDELISDEPIIEIIKEDIKVETIIVEDTSSIDQDVSPKELEKESISIDIPVDKIEDKLLVEKTLSTEESQTSLIGDESDEMSKDSKRKDRKKKKKKQYEETEPGESPQLKGLTVLGKIELSKPKPEPEKPASKSEKKPFYDKRDKKESDSKAGDHKTVDNKSSDHKTVDNKSSDNKTTKFKKRKHSKPDTSEHISSHHPDRTISSIIKDKEKDKLKFTESPTTSDSKSTKLKEKEIPKAKDNEKEDRKKRKRKKTIREMISQEEVDKAIKATLSGMDSSAFTSQRAKLRMKKRLEREEKEQKIRDDKDKESKVLKLSEFVTTGDLANMMNINSSEIILKCMELGLMVTINQRLDKDTITLIADDYGYEVDFLDDKEVQFIEDDNDDEDTLVQRPPIVTIMGHVDHGKTSLLDFIRNANVVAGEAGGITQHIGAYSVTMSDGKSITFLDTPGHEAFTAMRARGAQVTDIVILVVAADDSVMPQTIEAISHARAANVPIIVAINKIDKADANPDRIRQQLSDYGVLVEEWGGKNQSVEISAKKGINIDKLLEKVLIEAELLDLKANFSRLCRGIVIESNMKKGWGSTATIIVQKGTLRVGDSFVSGIYSGKVRALLNERENKIEESGPSTPVIVIGYDGLPEVGDTIIATSNDAEARRIANERKQVRREQDMRKVRYMTLDQISAQIQIGGIRELNLVLKGDVSGSLEALSDSLLKLSREEVRVNILHKGVGHITETDVMLAAASSAVVIGFNVNPNGKARKAAENEMVDIRVYDIIYDCLNEIQLALEGLLAPEYKEEITASVEIRKTFKVSRMGTIAGCFVKSGKITRNDKVRVLRDGFSEFEGAISSLKRGKDDVKEVDAGFECGIQLLNFNDIMEGDIIEAFKIIEIKRKFK